MRRIGIKTERGAMGISIDLNFPEKKYVFK